MRTPLQKGENILLKTHTSWVVLVVPALIVLAALALAAFINTGWWYLILLLPALGYFGWKYLEWKHNIWSVTNFRVIDESGVININTKESPLDKINNVSYQQDIWGRIFGFGDVEIQTAASMGETVYRMVEKPKQLKDTITAAQAELGQSRFTTQMNAFVEQTRQQNPPPAQPPQQAGAYVSMPQSTPPPAVNHHIASELEKLFELRQKGILTEAEYQQAKTRLLGA